jgi:hypothetical protein
MPSLERRVSFRSILLILVIWSLISTTSVFAIRYKMQEDRASISLISDDQTDSRENTRGKTNNLYSGLTHLWEKIRQNLKHNDEKSGPTIIYNRREIPEAHEAETKINTEYMPGSVVRREGSDFVENYL